MLAKGLVLAIAAVLAQSTWAYPHHAHQADGKLGAVASESSECTQIGVDLLSQGGSAADALVGTVLCVGVVGMYHAGIGGGGFMVVRSPNGSHEFVNFRETAPTAAFQDMFNNNTDLSIYGGLASGVPGELRGLEYLHGRYGRLPWKNVVLPAAHLARDGFRVSEDLIHYMDAVSDGGFLVDDPAWAVDFAPHGYRIRLNETMTRKRYAKTLETIAHEGPGAFYTGAIANATIAALQKAGGIMTSQDLENYTAVTQPVMSTTYRGFTLSSGGAPCSGAVGLSALKILGGYENLGDPAEVNLTTHRLNEALRFAYGERTELGDPAFVEGMTEYQSRMLSDEAAARIRSKIQDHRTQNISAYNPKGIESLDTPGTSHIVAADRSGMAVSVTSTINLLFGSRLMVPETGIIMNNEMNDFSIPNSSNAFGYIPSEANFIRPGKRPLSSITPVIIEYPNGGGLFAAVGAAGGSRIITATVQNIHHMIDAGMAPREALAQPRLHDQLVPNVVQFEYTYDNATVAYIKELGSNVTWMDLYQSEAQALRLLPNGTFESAGEPRQHNSAGYAV